jgi:hypothetical protein
MFADAARREMRDRVRPILVRFERDIARLVGWVTGETGAVSIPWRLIEVDVRYQDWAPSPDPVGETTAITARVGLGLQSIVEEVAMREGVSTTSALAIVQRRLKESRELGLIAGVEAPDANRSQVEQDGASGDGADQAADSESDGDGEGDGAGAV